MLVSVFEAESLLREMKWRDVKRWDLLLSGWDQRRLWGWKRREKGDSIVVRDPGERAGGASGFDFVGGSFHHFVWGVVLESIST